MKQLYLGNEAIARGAYEAGVRVVSSYPGTPSTEITEYAATYPELYAEWATNEKVALEVAYGACVGGARALSCMKHVGLNVAADPLFTASYTGVNAGLVIVVADDPGMHSSQNEQNSRYYAKSAMLPMLEPADSQEALDFIKAAYDMSETWDTPVLVRITTRIAHARTLVELGQRQDVPVRPYQKNTMKFVMMPGMARKRRQVVGERMRKMKQSGGLGFDRVEMADRQIGIVTSGAAYQYVKEALPNASVYKLGKVYPLPIEEIKQFAAQVESLIVVEEMEPFIEEQLLAEGIACQGKNLLPDFGELSTALIASRIGGQPTAQVADDSLPGRPPVLCPGCPHRGVFYVFKKMGLHVSGDIGCYTLGALAPLNSMDTSLCMGGAVSIAYGVSLAQGAENVQKWVGVIGDSTFFHSGMTGLATATYNQGRMTLVILDNRITGMTGHQHHPGTGTTLKGVEGIPLSLEAVCRALGVRDVHVVSADDIKGIESHLKQAQAFDGVSVVIVEKPCALLKSVVAKPPVSCDLEKCKDCGICMKIGCPAICKVEGGVYVDASICTGCDLCTMLCRFGALGRENHE